MSEPILTRKYYYENTLAALIDGDILKFLKRKLNKFIYLDGIFEIVKTNYKAVLDINGPVRMPPKNERKKTIEKIHSSRYLSGFFQLVTKDEYEQEFEVFSKIVSSASTLSGGLQIPWIRCTSHSLIDTDLANENDFLFLVDPYSAFETLQKTNRKFRNLKLTLIGVKKLTNDFVDGNFGMIEPLYHEQEILKETKKLGITPELRGKHFNEGHPAGDVVIIKSPSGTSEIKENGSQNNFLERLTELYEGKRGNQYRNFLLHVLIQMMNQNKSIKRRNCFDQILSFIFSNDVDIVFEKKPNSFILNDGSIVEVSKLKRSFKRMVSTLDSG